VGWTPLYDGIRLVYPSTLSEKDIYYQRNMIANNSESKVMVTPTIVRQYHHSEIDRLKSLFIFREPDQIDPLLSKNRTLRGLISSTYTKIRKEFPSEDIILEAISDSPLSNEKDIVISVSTSLPVDEAIEHLDKVEDVRWNKDSEDPYVDICVKLEYQ
jgi:hypothetical protein